MTLYRTIAGLGSIENWVMDFHIHLKSIKIQLTDLHRPSTVIIQLGKVNLATLCYDPLTVL